VSALRRTLLLATLAARAAAGEVEADADFVHLSLPVDGAISEARFADLDGDGRLDLVLSLLPPAAGSRRELRIYPQGADGYFPTTPAHTVKVPDDAITCAIADVRPEPGRELVFLTRSGAFSYSPTHPGLKDNIRRLATLDLLYQVPSSGALNFWSYVLEAQGGDLLMLPGGGDVTLWGPRTAPKAEGESDDYALRTDWGAADLGQIFSAKSPGALAVTRGGVRVQVASGDSDGLFLSDALAVFAAMLEANARYRAPALVDVDGDGRKDVLVLRDDGLHVHLAGADGFSAEPTRIEPLPEWLDKDDADLNLRLADIDHDGDVDLVARSKPAQHKLDSVTFTYFVLLNDGQRLVPEQPSQVLRFDGTGTDSELTDVDGDGRLDLVVTKYVLPSLTDLVTGFRLERGAYVFLGKARGPEPFERKAAMRDEQVFTMESLQDALVARHIPGDLSGDGVADLVEVDLTGRVAVRRIHHEAGAFGGGSWELDDGAWKRFDLGSDLARLQLQDVNGDGLTDIGNPRAGSYELVLSRKGSAR
jgi:hypothetical protein